MWEANDLGLVEYCLYKNLKTEEMVKIFDVSTQTISNQRRKIKNPEYYSGRIQDKVKKGLLLEAQIRSGKYPDHRKRWDTRITRITNIAYSYDEPKEEPEVVEKKMVEKVVEDAPVLQLTINTASLIKLIKIWKGYKL